MTITSASFSENNNTLTTVHNVDTAVTEITLSGYHAAGVTPTFVRSVTVGNNLQRIWSFEPGSIRGSSVTVTDAETTTPVAVTGFERQNIGYINQNFTNYETFPLELITDKNSIDLSISRTTIISSDAKKWSIPGLTLFSTNELEKRYLTKYLLDLIYEEDVEFSVGIPTEVNRYVGSREGRELVIADGVVPSGAKTLNIDARDNANDLFPVGTFFSFEGISRVFSVTNSTMNSIEFTPAVPREISDGTNLNLNPSFRMMVTNREINIEAPPGARENGESIGNFTRITLDLEEI